MKKSKKLEAGSKKQEVRSKKTPAISATPVWNLKLLYASSTDPQIEKDMQAFEKLAGDFAKKYDTTEKAYLSDVSALRSALDEYENLIEKANGKFVLYFSFIRDTDASNKVAPQQLALMENRLAKVDNMLTFFGISIGQMNPEMQKQVLKEASLAKYKVFLQRIFDDAKHQLSVAEEKIMNLKSLPAYSMWIDGNERYLNTQSVEWGKRKMPLAQALQEISGLKTSKERASLAAAVAVTLKKVAPFSEAEINAIFTNKKIDDELRGYKTAYENTVLGYRNEPQVVENLVNVVTEGFALSQRFYKLKAKMMKMKTLAYSDRSAKIGEAKVKFPYSDAVAFIKKTFGEVDAKYPKILQEYIDNGQIDVSPRLGKQSGAYCCGSYNLPTFVLLNHIGDLRSLTTFAHEMGHAFHTELSKSQGPIYCNYSTSLAETASTLFESIALDAVIANASAKDKMVLLHDKLNETMATIFRQIACFNFEKDIHHEVRTKGYVAKEELADLHNKNMSRYLGSTVKMQPDDGYYFVHWSHIRRFFYVYSYAYGMLVSKALLRRYRQDTNFWSSIEKFLSSGGKDSPENILREIGVDVSDPAFFRDGLKEIEKDVDELEKLVKLC